MLFQRFILITTVIALMGVALSHVIESTHRQPRGFAIEQRLDAWKLHDARQACKLDKRHCAALSVLEARLRTV